MAATFAVNGTIAVSPPGGVVSAIGNSPVQFGTSAAGVQTVGFASATLMSIPLVDNTFYSTRISVIAADRGSTESVLWEIVQKLTIIGGAPTFGDASIIFQPDAGLVNANIIPGLTGLNYVISVVGVAGKTINWAGYIQLTGVPH